MCEGVCIYLYAYINIYKYIHISVSECVLVYTCKYVGLQTVFWMCMHEYRCCYMYMYVTMCRFVYVYVCMYICMYVYMYVCIYVCKRTFLNDAWTMLGM